MNFSKAQNIDDDVFETIRAELDGKNTLGLVLSWAELKPKGTFSSGIVEEVITQDEFTHDVITPYKDIYLVFDTT